MKRSLKYNLIKFLRLKGAPGKLALGFAVGACINFYPTFGIGIPLAALAAGILFSSVPAGILGDIIFKPLFPVFFYLNLVSGYLIWARNVEDISCVWKSMLHPDLNTLLTVGKAFFTGALINSLILGTILYIFIYFVVERYRLPLLHRLVGRGRRK